MRRKDYKTIIFMLFALLIVLSACNNKTEDPDDLVKGVEGEELTEDMEDAEDIDEDIVMKDFNNLIEGKYKLDRIIELIDMKIQNLSETAGDEMVFKLEKLLEMYLDELEDNILKQDTSGELTNIGDSQLFFPEDRVEAISNEKLRGEVLTALNSKYKLINKEGSYNLIIDYEKLAKYDKYISPEFKEYLTLRAIDSREPLAMDGALHITYNELAKRIFAIEDYIVEYPKGERYERMLGDYRDKLSIYLLGLDNSPIADWETGKINSDLLENYRNTKKIKDKTTAYIVGKQLDAMEENDYIIHQETSYNVLSLINEALSLLEQD